MLMLLIQPNTMKFNLATLSLFVTPFFDYEKSDSHYQWYIYLLSPSTHIKWFKIALPHPGEKQIY